MERFICQYMEQLDMEQEKSFDHLIRKLKMGKRCFSVDFSSKVLVAMNHGQPAEARNKVRATLLGRDHKEQARRERVGVTEKTGTIEDIAQGRETRETPWPLPPLYLLIFYQLLAFLLAKRKGIGSLENIIEQGTDWRKYENKSTNGWWTIA